MFFLEDNEDELLDLDIEEDFDLDLDIELDIFDEADDDDEESQLTFNDKSIISDHILYDNTVFLDQDFNELLENSISNEEFNENKNDLKNKFLDNLSKFFLIEYPFDDNAQKRAFFRYRIISENLFDSKQIEILKNFNIDLLEYNRDEEVPVYYADEWIDHVAKGYIGESAGEDVTQLKKNNTPEKMKIKIKKELESALRSIDELTNMRDNNVQEFSVLSKKVINSGGKKPYSVAKEIKIISELLSVIENTGSRIKILHEKITSLKDQLSKYSDVDAIEDNSSLILSEYNCLLDMQKMLTGPRGNHFSFYTGNYFTPYIFTRETIQDEINSIKKLIPDIFYRKFLGIETNKCPYVCLLPCYGNKGICWEAIDPANKESGRGKIMVPVYSQKKSDELVVEALADYFWNKNKLSAGSRWLEEGITGKYYMFHQDLKLQKRKGKEVKVIPDLKESFIYHFKQWVLEEKKGRNKLPKNLRQIFWINIPFNDEVKEELSNRGFAYKELFENDKRRNI